MLEWKKNESPYEESIIRIQNVYGIEYALKCPILTGDTDMYTNIKFIMC